LTNFVDGWGFILRVTDEDGKMLEDFPLVHEQPYLSNGVSSPEFVAELPEVLATSATNSAPSPTGNSSADALTQIPMKLSHWAKSFSGAWEETAEGIKLYATSYRGGNRIYSRTFYNFVNSQLFAKWMPHGGNGYNYAGFYNAISGHCNVGGTTHHAYRVRNTRIYDDTWYYTRIKVNEDKTWTVIMSTGDYDINGGRVAWSQSRTTSDDLYGHSDDLWGYVERGNIHVIFGDNYAGTSAYMIIAEVKTDATPVQTTILSAYDFENAVDVPAEFNFKGNWVIDTIGFNSSKSLHNTDSPSRISLKVTDAASVSFKIKCSGPYLSSYRFSVDGVRHHDFLCREILDQWNEVIFPIPGTGTRTLKWSSIAGASLWIDDITIYALDNSRLG